MFSKLWDERTARILITFLIFLLSIGFLRGAHETIILFVLAIFYSYLVEPAVSLLQKLLHGRIRAIIAFNAILLTALVALGFFLGPLVVDEARSLLASLPALADRIASGQFIATLGNNHGWSKSHQAQLQHLFMAHRGQILTYGETAAQQLESPLSRSWWIILIPILGVFFLKDSSQISHDLVALGTESRERYTIRGILSDVHKMLGSYIRAQLILAGLTAVFLTITLTLMKVPNSFVLGPIAGACEFVPVVGPAVAAVMIFGLAAVIGYNHLLWLFLMLGTWRIIQDYFNAPRVMGTSLSISPLAEIFGVLAGGEIAGVIGALVAVPLIAMLPILWHRLGDADRSLKGTDSTETSASSSINVTDRRDHGALAP